MKISFSSRSFAEICNDSRQLFKRYGTVHGKLIARRIQQLQAANTLEAMRNALGRCEELVGDRRGQFVMRTDKNYRLIFQPDHDPLPLKADGGLDWQQVTNIIIVEVEDYH